MQTYWLTDRTKGEATLVDGETIEQVLGVEFGYVEWCIKSDGAFENGKWKVAGQVTKGGWRKFVASAK